MNYYVFLINKPIPTKEEFYYNETNYYEKLIFISLEKEDLIKDYIMLIDDKDISIHYFIFNKDVRSKCKIYSYNRYYGGFEKLNAITMRIIDIENCLFTYVDYFSGEECEIPESDGKVNIYSNKLIDNDFLNVIEIKEDNIKEIYIKELNYDHDFDKSYFYYLFNTKLYKLDTAKSYLDKEDCNIKKVNQLEKLDRERIERHMSNSKYFDVYLLNSDTIPINTNIKTNFIHVKTDREIFNNVIVRGSMIDHNTYFVIKDNTTIYVKWRSMSYRAHKIIEDIKKEFEINIYSNKEIEGYEVIIADSPRAAYYKEIYKDHYKRDGFFLYVKDNLIYRLAIRNSVRSIEILNKNLEESIKETNLLDWRYD